MRPERIFVRKLKELDKRLDCIWQPKLERFNIIYKRPYEHDWNVLLITTQNGGFRHPNDKDIHKLRKSDTHKFDVLGLADKYMRAYKEKRRREIHEFFKDATKDNYNQIKHAFLDTDLGAYRKISYKSKGKIFK